MSDPRILIIFGLFFVVLGGYNLVVGRRRLLAHPGSSPLKQVNILTGSEYLLLALVFFISALARTTLLPAWTAPYLLGVSFALLIISLVLAVMVVRMGFRGRTASGQSSETASGADGSQAKAAAQTTTGPEIDPALKEAQRRERRRRRLEYRRKRAEQRRRRAGKA
ncbi:hypothetical protein [Thermogemmatispora sp.]|uniref:hypothetical protein n=1 Tax=Thermogemmatispora sp. TaxID=1968838 RepID=UPI001D67FD71|nr:hypothetical protein [Thermogemmatispora sp.]MBX5449622.1 hypothetical protein [Thermogemmatispora sp.]